MKMKTATLFALTGMIILMLLQIFTVIEMITMWQEPGTWIVKHTFYVLIKFIAYSLFLVFFAALYIKQR